MIRHSVRKLPSVAVLALALVCPVPSSAADWARWLGPEQSGRSPEREVFGAEEPQVAVTWSHELGAGYSAIAVAGGKALTMYSDGKTDWLIALDAASGERAWRHAVHPTLPKPGASDGGPLSMPVVDDGLVYAFGAAGRLVAVQLADGTEVWSRDLASAFDAPRPYFGFTTTPLVVGDKLFLQVGAKVGRSLVAFDKKTGKTIWQVGDEPVGYQSPIATTLAGTEQIVAVTDLSVQGLQPEDGKVLWRAEHGIGDSVGFATPVLIDADAFVLVGRKASVAIRVTRGESGFAARELWRGPTLKRNFANPVLHEGHLYGYDSGFLACVAADSGAQAWKQKLDAVGLVLVDGHLVVLKADGALLIVPADPKGFRPRLEEPVAGSGGQTSPSFSDGAIYVRNLERIVRVDVE